MMPELQEALVPLTGSDLEAISREEIRIMLAAFFLNGNLPVNTGIDRLTIENRGIRFDIIIRKRHA